MFFSFFLPLFFHFFHFYLALFFGCFVQRQMGWLWGWYTGHVSSFQQGFYFVDNVESDTRMGGHIKTNSECENAGDGGNGHMHGCVYVDFV
ncbi:hypothetical protein HDV62DRAFT_159198 [Trichoderma sp. SZMC 28011]